MSLCPEGEYRNTLSDEEFWAHIFQTDYQESDGPDFDDPTVLLVPCYVCGSMTACGYDSEGRPMIHSMESEDE
jgi:hypothetical protein